MNIPDDVIKNLMKVYEKIYLASRDDNLSREDQDGCLDKLVDLILKEQMEKLLEEDSSISKNDAFEYIKLTKKLMEQWKVELDKKRYGKGWRELFNKQK